MILEKIIESTKMRVNHSKKQQPLEIIKEIAAHMPIDKKFVFEDTLRTEELSFICEVKKSSPSKGIIAEDFPYIEIANEYENAGAACISVLTEPDYFLGNNQYLEEISTHVDIPIIRKDFIIDSYQIYESKIIGASAILLISSILDREQLNQYIRIADSLGISALVEAHSREEVLKSLEAGARMIGVNNRNLKNFQVNFSNCIELRDIVPSNVIYISESGINSSEQIQELKTHKVNAVLIGEALMRSSDKKALLEEWRTL
nr:indole-3-glycerol phosphate synthase TrpC [uncultured Aminipila sp.]